MDAGDPDHHQDRQPGDALTSPRRLAASAGPIGFPAAFALLVAAVLCFKLVFLELWLLNNDNYITLSTFFSSAGHDDYVAGARRFYAAEVAACEPGDVRCVAYSGALLGEQTYARPITAWSGTLLVDRAWLGSADAFLRGIAQATVVQVAASALVLVLMLAVFLAALPPAIGASLAALLVLFGIIAHALPEQGAFAGFQPLLGVSTAAALGVVALALIAWPIGRRAGRVAALSAPSARARTLIWTAAAGVLAARLVSYHFPALYFAAPLAGSGVGLFPLMLSLLGLVVFGGAVAAAVGTGRDTARTMWMTLFLLFAFVAAGEAFFASSFHIAPRGHIYLLAAPIMVYTALNPNSRAIWLLPALALFHVSVAGLVFGCIAATEMVASARRRAPSVALVLSFVLLALAAVHTYLTGGNVVVAASADSIGAVVSRIEVLTLAPGIAVLAVLAVAGWWAWRMPDPRGDFLLRAVVLAALLAGAGQLRYALAAAGFDIMDPAAYTFILLSYYLAPAVCQAGLFLVMFAIAAPPVAQPRPGMTIRFDALSLMAAAVVALVAARGANGVGRPADTWTALVRGATLVATRAVSTGVEPLVRDAASPDDRYIVGPGTADAVTMTSVLKMRVRAAAGLLQADRVEVVVAPRPAP